MTPNPTIREILIDYKGVKPYRKYDKLKLNEAQSQIEAIILEIIGPRPEIAVRGSTQNPDNPVYWTKKSRHKIELWNEQRQRLNKYLGKPHDK